jgi:hypothetical protein
MGLEDGSHANREATRSGDAGQYVRILAKESAGGVVQALASVGSAEREDPVELGLARRVVRDDQLADAREGHASRLAPRAEGSVPAHAELGFERPRPTSSCRV